MRVPAKRAIASKNKPSLDGLVGSSEFEGQFRLTHPAKHMKKASTELPIIQKTYDLIRWYVPHLNRLPRDHKFMLGNRLIEGLYELLDGVIFARYSTEKLSRLESLNSLLDVIRYQTRLLKDFELLDLRRYEFVSRLIDEIGRNLGGWIGQQRSLQER
mgnify:CR=1 FL=1